MMTLSGRFVDQVQGVPTLEDVAVGLSRMPRFAGQTTELWTVAHHTLVMFLMALEPARRNPETWAFLPIHALFHDVHEVLTGDIPTSFKTLDMSWLQRKLDIRIYNHYGLPMPSNQERAMVHFYDMEALVAEAEAVTPQATFNRIVKEMGMGPSDFARKAVSFVRGQANDYEDVSVWLHRVLRNEVANYAN